MAKDEIKLPKVFLAVLSGLLLTSTFPKIGFAWLAWIALVPLLLSIKNLSPKNSFSMGYITGLVHFVTLVYWLIHTMRMYGSLPLYLCLSVLLLLSMVMALYVAVFSLLLTRLCSTPLKMVFMTPLLWVAFEYLRTFLFTGFPWELFGYSQHARLTLIQFADITGVYGISFILALTNSVLLIGLLFFLKSDWQTKPVSQPVFTRSLAVLLLLFVLIFVYGKRQIIKIDALISNAPVKRVAVVQGNIDQTIKWDPAFQINTTQKYIALSASARPSSPDLIVWPETATPFYFNHNKQLSNMIRKGIITANTSFLIGSPSMGKQSDRVEYYNSALLFNQDGKVVGKYNKAHLVPYGEYIPFKNWFPFLGKMVQEVGDFWPGKKGITIDWDEHPLGVQICYEIIFAHLSRALVKNGAMILINITNDAWYGRSSMPYQHFHMTVFRAIENRRALVRSANTGISGFIDPAGRVISRSALFKEAVMTQAVPLLKTQSIYSRTGDFFAWICLSAVLIVGLFSLTKGYKKKS